MIVSHRHRFIFLKTKKTAGTSVEVLLSKYCGSEDIVTKVVPEEDGHLPRNWQGRGNVLTDLQSMSPKWHRSILRRWFFGEQFFNHMPAELVKHRLGEEVWSSYFKFTIERHPLEKTRSHFLMLRARSGGRLSLEEYFRRGRFCTNYPIYTDKQNAIAVDKVLKFENLEGELQETLVKLNVEHESIELPRAKSSYRARADHGPVVFTSKQLETLRKAFEWETAHFGYDMREL